MSAAAELPTIAEPKVRLTPARLAPGMRGRLTVTLDIPEGCHIQSHAPAEPFLIPTVVEIDPAGDVEVGAPAYPTPVVERFAWTPVQLEVHLGRVDVELPIEVGPSAAPRTTLTGRVRYQMCTATTCLAPVEHSIATEIWATSRSERTHG